MCMGLCVAQNVTVVNECLLLGIEVVKVPLSFKTVQLV